MIDDFVYVVLLATMHTQDTTVTSLEDVKWIDVGLMLD
jgi:hypothetical protein